MNLLLDLLFKIRDAFMRRRDWPEVTGEDLRSAMAEYREKSGEPISEEAIALNEQLVRRLRKRRPHDA